MNNDVNGWFFKGQKVNEDFKFLIQQVKRTSSYPNNYSFSQIPER